MTPPGDPLDPIALAAEIDRQIRALPVEGVQPVRAVRRAWSRRLRSAPAEAVAGVAMVLVHRQRWVAYELLYHHPGGLDSLGVEDVERLGEGMADWGSVDAFGCLVSGPAWRRGRLPDEALHHWAASPDRWWRRAALVSTVPLNLRSRGGTGDAGRTLDVCRRLVTDGDDMVVKALSWALRELVVWDPRRCGGFWTPTTMCSRPGSGGRSAASWRAAASIPPGARPDPGSGQPADRVSRRIPRK